MQLGSELGRGFEATGATARPVASACRMASAMLHTPRLSSYTSMMSFVCAAAAFRKMPSAPMNPPG